MSDASLKPSSKHAIDAHVWIGAFAAAMITFSLVYSHTLESLGGMLGISGLAVQKLDGQVASMRQEIADLRQTVQASKTAIAAKIDAPATLKRHP
jgi:polysaccharide pyruvyl transferase WcaK-like protein